MIVEFLIGTIYLGEYAKAAELCPKVFGTDSKQWEEEVFLFIDRNQLHVGLR
jgi:vacuolar protein sorting-associated protein 41